MLYDKSFERFKFSTDQFIDQGTATELKSDYDSLTRRLLHDDYRAVNKAMYGYDQEGSKLSGIILAAIMILGMASVIAFALMKNIDGVLISFAGIFLLAGVMTLLGKSLIGKHQNTSKERFKMRLRGFIITVVSAAIIALELNKDKFDGAMIYIVLFIFLFGAAALWLILFAFIDIFAKVFLYREIIDAKCIGYVRLVSSDSVESSTMNVNRRFLYIMTSPVFEYNYNGQHIEALYDDFVVTESSDVELGTYESIRINPRHPEDIYSPKATKINSIVYVIFGLFAAAATILVAYFGLSGNYTIETGSGSQVVSGPVSVNDEMIEEMYASDIDGREWYIETMTIDSIETSDSNIILRFEDPGMRGVRIPSTDQYEEGDSIYILYTIDEEYLDSGAQYKDTFILIDPDEYVYIGNHGAYEG